MPRAKDSASESSEDEANDEDPEPVSSEGASAERAKAAKPPPPPSYVPKYEEAPTPPPSEPEATTRKASLAPPTNVPSLAGVPAAAPKAKRPVSSRVKERQNAMFGENKSTEKQKIVIEGGGVAARLAALKKQAAEDKQKQKHSTPTVETGGGVKERLAHLRENNSFDIVARATGGFRLPMVAPPPGSHRQSTEAEDDQKRADLNAKRLRLESQLEQKRRAGEDTSQDETDLEEIVKALADLDKPPPGPSPEETSDAADNDAVVERPASTVSLNSADSEQRTPEMAVQKRAVVKHSRRKKTVKRMTSNDSEALVEAIESPVPASIKVIDEDAREDDPSPAVTSSPELTQTPPMAPPPMPPPAPATPSEEHDTNDATVRPPTMTPSTPPVPPPKVASPQPSPQPSPQKSPPAKDQPPKKPMRRKPETTEAQASAAVPKGPPPPPMHTVRSPPATATPPPAMTKTVERSAKPAPKKETAEPVVAAQEDQGEEVPAAAAPTASGKGGFMRRFTTRKSATPAAAKPATSSAKRSVFGSKGKSKKNYTVEEAAAVVENLGGSFVPIAEKMREARIDGPFLRAMNKTDLEETLIDLGAVDRLSRRRVAYELGLEG